MWLYIVVVALVVIGIFGGIFAGGIFTIVLLPLALLVLIAAVAWRSLGQMAAQSQPQSLSDKPLPHNSPAEPSPDAPATPDQLVSERQVRH